MKNTRCPTDTKGGTFLPKMSVISNSYFRMVADAVGIEPVSASQFPANREKNREFFDFGSVLRIRALISPTVTRAFEPNSLLIGTGNFSGGTGICFKKIGNFNSQNRKAARSFRHTRLL